MDRGYSRKHISEFWDVSIFLMFLWRLYWKKTSEFFGFGVRKQDKFEWGVEKFEGAIFVILDQKLSFDIGNRISIDVKLKTKKYIFYGLCNFRWGGGYGKRGFHCISDCIKCSATPSSSSSSKKKKLCKNSLQSISKQSR